MTDAEKLSNLWHWKNGNGSPGAAVRLEDHERRLDVIELHHAREDLAIINAVKKALKEREEEQAKKDSSWTAKMKVGAMYLAPILSFLTALLVWLGS